MNLILSRVHEEELISMGANPSEAKMKNSLFYREMQNVTGLDAFSRFNGANNIPFVTLAKMTKLLPNFVELDISGNGLGKDCLEVVKNLSPHIKILNLTGNRLFEYAVEIAKVLSNSEIVELNLSYNSLRKDGPAVTAHLSKMQYLEKLNLCGNELGKHGTLTVANLTESETLNSLGLYDNKLGLYTPDVAEVSLEIKGLRNIDLVRNCQGDDSLTTKNIFDDHNEKVQDIEIVNCLKDIYPVDLGQRFGTTGDVVRLVGGIGGEDYDMTNLHEIKVSIS